MTQDEIIETNRRQMFASARGARIQIFVSETRIHPDDEHLQYGLISTALREMAKQPKTIHHKGVNLPHFGFTIFASSESELREVLQCDKLTHSLFLLILAECLADEGM